MKDGWEIVADWSNLNRKATRMMEALLAAAPKGTSVMPAITGRRRLAMLYGPGAPEKLPQVRAHIARGGHVAMWDLGYWDRADGGMRLAIDALHPTADQLALAPIGPGRRHFDLREDAAPGGPILLIGVGPKSVYAYGLGAPQSWERSKVESLRRRFPGRPILWRPKGRHAMPLLDLQLRHGMPIEEALRGCSLVVCRHSNVSIDAAVAGVPVECDDGAAAALYAGNPAPTREQRAEFLRRLSYWQWSRHEAPAAWAWIERIVA